MKTQLADIFTRNWHRKVIAIVMAIFIWFIVNHSITTTKTISNIPIKILGLPTDKTIEGLLPNGYLSKRISLTLSGKKSLINELESNDFEIVLNAENKSDDWIVTISKKNLVSLNPDLNIRNNISTVFHNELIIRLSKLITDTISVKINTPVGEPPRGYQFLDIWPQQLTYTVSGPEEQIMELKNKGLQITFNLSEISKIELDELKIGSYPFQKDEVIFFVPDHWKNIPVPFHSNSLRSLTDPEARKLHIAFLKKSMIPLKQHIPIKIFFPPKYRSTINPETYSLEESPTIKRENGLEVLTIPLYAKNISQLFLGIIQDSIEFSITAAPKTEQEYLPWSVQFIDPKSLENKYVNLIITNEGTNIKENIEIEQPLREKQLRDRFRQYMREFKALNEKGRPLELKIELQGSFITVEDISS